MMKLWLILLVLCLPACGMQGDLYLPEEQAATATSATPDKRNNKMINKAASDLIRRKQTKA